MKSNRLDRRARAIQVVEILRKATRGMVEPASFQIVQKFGREPFLILISCLLSLRTRDTVSFPASVRLFEHAQTPEAMLQISKPEIAKIIYPVGFYRNKARTIHAVCRMLLDEFEGTVPKTEAELLSLPGVGRKTANLVLGCAFGIPALCVDTHVHRISNRLGLVATVTPEETEMALKEVVPQEHWIEFNRLLVMWGQNICVPISPLCSRCPLLPICPQVGVVKSR